MPLLCFPLMAHDMLIYNCFTTQMAIIPFPSEGIVESYSKETGFHPGFLIYIHFVVICFVKVMKKNMQSDMRTTAVSKFA